MPPSQLPSRTYNKRISGYKCHLASYLVELTTLRISGYKCHLASYLVELTTLRISGYKCHLASYLVEPTTKGYQDINAT